MPGELTWRRRPPELASQFSIPGEGADGVLIFQISTETTVENQSYVGGSVTTEGNADGKLERAAELRSADSWIWIRFHESASSRS